MDNLMKKNKQKKKTKLVIVNMVFLMILAVGIIKSETMNIGITGVNAANATYDMYKPNTWATDTEISFGNNVYGVRKTGTFTATAQANNRVQMLTTTGVTGILAHGGYWKSNGTAIGPGTGGGKSFISWYTGPSYSPVNTLCIDFITNTALTNATYDFWILYTK